jgi:hypothetical protein
MERLDDPSVAQFAAQNDTDSISGATPTAAGLFTVSAARPPDGDYVVHVEVSREFDQNAFHDHPSLPIEEAIWASYGAPSVGQPSVLYRIPIAVRSDQPVAGRTLHYDGYGAFDGADGTIHAPDPTITTDRPGSGAGRLSRVRDPAGDYRVRVTDQ